MRFKSEIRKLVEAGNLVKMLILYKKSLDDGFKKFVLVVARLVDFDVVLTAEIGVFVTNASSLVEATPLLQRCADEAGLGFILPAFTY